MDMEGILAITFIFGGGTLWLLSLSPVGKAIAEQGLLELGDEPLAEAIHLDEHGARLSNPPSRD